MFKGVKRVFFKRSQWFPNRKAIFWKLFKKT